MIVVALGACAWMSARIFCPAFSQLAAVDCGIAIGCGSPFGEETGTRLRGSACGDLLGRRRVEPKEIAAQALCDLGPFRVSACPLAFPLYAYGISWRFDAIRNAPVTQVREMVTDAFKDVPSTLARKS